MCNEIWKPVPGYEEYYEISNLGRVRRIKGENSTYVGKILKQHPDGTGYLIVVLSKNNKTKNFSVHRLVAQAFLPNPDNKPQVNHIDGNKLNNAVDNLEWATRSENMQHAFRNGLVDRKRMSDAQKGKHLTEKTRQRISEAFKGKNNPMYGKHFSEEHKRKISEANRRRWQRQKEEVI